MISVATAGGSFQSGWTGTGNILQTGVGGHVGLRRKVNKSLSFAALKCLMTQIYKCQSPACILVIILYFLYVQISTHDFIITTHPSCWDGCWTMHPLGGAVPVEPPLLLTTKHLTFISVRSLSSCSYRGFSVRVPYYMFRICHQLTQLPLESKVCSLQINRVSCLRLKKWHTWEYYWPSEIFGARYFKYVTLDTFSDYWLLCPKSNTANELLNLWLSFSQKKIKKELSNWTLGHTL